MIREWWHKAPEVSNFSGHGSVFMFHTQKTLRKTLKIRDMETARHLTLNQSGASEESTGSFLGARPDVLPLEE